MNISAISQNRYYNTYSANRNKTQSTSFKGVLNDSAANRVIDMLKEKVTSIKICSSMDDLTPILKDLTRKWTNVDTNKNFVGIMVIPDKDLEKFLGNDASRYNTRYLKGICVGVGDNYGPVETWNKCYEAVTVLLPKFKL